MSLFEISRRNFVVVKEITRVWEGQDGHWYITLQTDKPIWIGPSRVPDLITILNGGEDAI